MFMFTRFKTQTFVKDINLMTVSNDDADDYGGDNAYDDDYGGNKLLKLRKR